jgi:hypothetical protein
MYTHIHNTAAPLRLEASISKTTVAHDFLACLPRVRSSLHVWGSYQRHASHPAQSELIQRVQSLKLNMFKALPFAPSISIICTL